MKKVVSVISVAVLAGSLFQGAAAKPPPKKQVVEGRILMMAPFPLDLNSCYAGAHRRAAVVTQGNNNQLIGFHFDIDPATNKKPFTLEVTGGQGDVDLDITFYTEFGTVEQATDTAYAPPNQSFGTREPGGEAGIVPPTMKKAIVCMWAGANATFTYTAGKGVKIPK